MPIENFEKDALVATFKDRPRRLDWMEMLQRRDNQADLWRSVKENEWPGSIRDSTSWETKRRDRVEDVWKDNC